MNELIESFLIAEKLRGMRVENHKNEKGEEFYILKYYDYDFYIFDEVITLLTYGGAFAQKLMRYLKTETNEITESAGYGVDYNKNTTITIKDTNENLYYFLVNLLSTIETFNTHKNYDMFLYGYVRDHINKNKKDS